MKKSCIGLMALLALASFAVAGSKYHVIEIKQRDKTKEYRVVSDEERKAVEKEIKEENRVYNKAMMAVQKEWKADESNRGSFPRSAAPQRSVRVIRTLTDSAAADELCSKYQIRAQGGDDHDDKPIIGKKMKGFQKSKEDIAKEKAKEAARDAEQQRARDMFEAQLQQLMGGGGQDAAAAPAEEAH